jgi:hypothetical protein
MFEMATGPDRYQAVAVGSMTVRQSESSVVMTITQFAGCSVQLTQFQ